MPGRVSQAFSLTICDKFIHPVTTVCTKLAATVSFAQFLAFAKSEFLEIISSFPAVLTSSKHLQPSLKLLRGEESSH